MEWGIAFAHEEGMRPSLVPYPQMDAALYGFLLLSALCLFALYYRKKIGAGHRKALFVLIAAVAGGTTLYLIASTVQLNMVSETGGPVHWHADFEIWACGERVELQEASGLANKVGSEALHHHNDYRIHVEGVLIKKNDASLGEFFESIGGSFSKDELTVITMDGKKTWHVGDACPDGSTGMLRMYVNGKINEEYDAYVIAPYSQVPPGDTIKIVFG